MRSRNRSTCDEDGRPYAGVYTAGTAAPVTFLVATNDRGDVVALTDTAGTWFARYTYHPYGRVLSQVTQAAGSITAALAGQIASRQPLRYAGYTYDAHSQPTTSRPATTTRPRCASSPKTPPATTARRARTSIAAATKFYPIVRTFISHKSLKNYAKQNRIESKVTRRYNPNYCWVDLERYVWMFNAADVIGVLPAFKVVSKLRPAWGPIAQRAAALAAKNVGKAGARSLYIQAAEPWRKPLPGTVVYLPASRVRFGNVAE